ncbi:ATPase [Actinidia chinensis var. chinensis]|uniref:ATPase n=1 Tax=Actinidia chinensis var. chinensis TaxID=1590841 RepID=A0A2R6Q5B7_ACTCC|nr:ATPase [Actinidia chinensis var. chinensis]
MEGLQKAYRDLSENPKPSSSFPSFSSSTERGAATLSSDQSRVIVARSARQVVSLSTCSKLCTICFVTGVVVGFSLKRRVRRWASMLLKRIKDD